MNKKFLTLLAVCLVAISMASVCAVELTKENDFDGIFKMSIVDNDTFEQMDFGNSYTGLLQSSAAYVNANNSTIVCIYADSNMDDALLAITYGGYDAQYGVNDANVTKEGDLALFNKTPDMDADLKDYSINTFAGKSDSDGKLTVFVGGSDSELVKEYANTIVFE